MEDQNSFVLTLTPYEIEWVLQQLNAPAKRLYMPALDIDTSVDYQQILSLLKSRGWIRSRSSGELALDVTVAGVVGALGFSKTALVLDLFCERSSNKQAYLYFRAEGLLIEQSSTNNEEIALTALRDLDTLRTRLYEHLGLQNQQAPREGTFKCTEEAFAAIPYTLAGDGKPAAITQLVQLGADERFASDLLCAMASPLQQVTLQVVQLDPEQPEGVRVTAKLNLIEGIYGLWALVTCFEGESPATEIIPCDAAQAKKYIDELLEGFVA